ncbi:hypothetical protein [Acidocella sp.]|uniref:hypothetical protein n=1 Tax=Acidocella sp. TaxID=50710 RepID=UPI00260BED42|nr:hypothetical protein [Acidocella sp.]
MSPAAPGRVETRLYGAVIGLSALAALLFDVYAHRGVSAHTGGFVPYDFDLFWHSARAFAQPVPDITPGIASFYYPPPFLLLITPFTRLPEPVAYICWDLLGGGAGGGVPRSILV